MHFVPGPQQTVERQWPTRRHPHLRLLKHVPMVLANEAGTVLTHGKPQAHTLGHGMMKRLHLQRHAPAPHKAKHWPAVHTHNGRLQRVPTEAPYALHDKTGIMTRNGTCVPVALTQKYRCRIPGHRHDLGGPFE